MNSDNAWEEWGRRDPYFAILTNEKYRNRNISDEVRKEFFQTGIDHINRVFKVCRDHLDRDFSPGNALDFGCGTGRIIVPLAKLAKHVTGLDVSDSMLQEAQKNCEEFQVRNVSLLRSDDDLSNLEGLFDFIHSVIVFQHIPVQRGKKIFMNLLDHLQERGIGVIHVSYAKTLFQENYGIDPNMVLKGIMESMSRPKRIINKMLLREDSKDHHTDLKKQEADPEMQMNSYNVNELFFIMHTAGIQKIHVEFTDHGGELGIILFFQKSG